MFFLAYHDFLFGVPACWSFHATSHGKGPCDGLGATIKRGVRTHTLQETQSADSQPIVCANHVATWAKEADTSLTVAEI
jgi:hypothetical protein